MWKTLYAWILAYLTTEKDLGDWSVQTLYTMAGKVMRIRDRNTHGEVNTLYEVVFQPDTLHTYFQVYSSRGRSLKGRVCLLTENYVTNNKHKTLHLYEIRVVYDDEERDTIRVIIPKAPDPTHPDWTHTYRSVVMQALHARVALYGIGRINGVMHPVMWYPPNTHSPIPNWESHLYP